MRAVLRKWGNSAALRLPAAVMAEAHLELDQDVELHVKDGRIIVEPAAPVGPSLEDLLAGVTPENLHDEIDFGPPTGREIL
ncbi:MAG TPA: AbrB/MazE/SpoVT family DNA-binding domain-containing protein [Methylocystis sp.]|nr:AbrB/MazE/SpoVT family DNA-binding domain-containing protein [Methylocystis sp.]